MPILKEISSDEVFEEGIVYGSSTHSFSFAPSSSSSEESDYDSEGLLCPRCHSFCDESVALCANGYYAQPSCSCYLHSDHALFCCDCMGKERILSDTVKCPKCETPYTQKFLEFHSKLPCEHYTYDGSCPYSDCNCAHIEKDGSRASSPVPKPYKQSPGNPSRVNSDRQLEKLLAAVEKELFTRYYRKAVEEHRLSFIDLGERVKMFIQRKLNYRLDRDQWDVVLDFCLHVYNFGFEDDDDDDDMDELDAYMRHLKMSAFVISAEDIFEYARQRGAFGNEPRRPKREEPSISREEAAKTFLPENVTKEAATRKVQTGGGSKKKKSGRRRR